MRGALQVHHLAAPEVSLLSRVSSPVAEEASRVEMLPLAHGGPVKPHAPSFVGTCAQMLLVTQTCTALEPCRAGHLSVACLRMHAHGRDAPGSKAEVRRHSRLQACWTEPGAEDPAFVASKGWAGGQGSAAWDGCPLRLSTSAWPVSETLSPQRRVTAAHFGD